MGIRRRVAARPRVVYQGEPGAFSEQAALKYFDGARPRGRPTFRAVFDEVASGGAEFGVLPIENSIMGSIYQNYDLLLEYDVVIAGELKLRISHNLIGHPGVALKDIRRLYAHPPAAGQCERFLRAHPAWTMVETYDTAGSVKLIKERGLRDAAAIASDQAARVYGMQILVPAVEDNPQNYTRFIVVSKRSPVDGTCTKTSVVYATRNQPGALYETLRVFAERKINLTKIESRPIPGRPWEYLFYLDFEGSAQCSHIEEALQALRARTERLRVLGCYRAC